MKPLATDQLYGLKQQERHENPSGPKLSAPRVKITAYDLENARTQTQRGFGPAYYLLVADTPIKPTVGIPLHEDATVTVNMYSKRTPFLLSHVLSPDGGTANETDMAHGKVQQ